MKLKIKIPAGMTKAMFKVKAKSPEIALVLGAVGVVGGTVFACKATVKSLHIVEDHKEKMEKIHSVEERVKAGEEVPCEDGTIITAEDVKQDVTRQYVQTSIKVVKAYLPAVLLIGGGMACFFGGHRIMKKRNLALVATCTALDKGWKEYRGRVVDRFGKDVDTELKHGITQETVTEKTVDEEGKTQKRKFTANIVETDGLSAYARTFERATSRFYNPSDYMVDSMLNSVEGTMNHLLPAREHVFLNEVYDALDLERTPEGQVVGWKFDPEDAGKDNHIQIQRFRCHRKLEDGTLEDIIVLDFNVDGVIVDEI